MPDRRWRRLGIRTVLLVGFSLTFGIWLFAGNYFLRRIGDIESRTAAVNVRYMHAQELLATVRAQILLSSVYVRDALLDPDPGATDYRSQVTRAYEVVNQALNSYVPVLDSLAERERVERLKRQLADSRQTMLEVLETDSTKWPADARVLLRTRVVPKRDMVIQVSEEVQAMNRAAFVQQQREVAEIYAASQKRLWQSLGVALAASFSVALLVAIYAGRLETWLQKERARDAHNTRELQALSAKLITAQEEERRTIARELHDEVGQALTAIKVELAVAQRAIEAGDAGPRVLRDVRSITENALSTVRDLSHLLHPALLDDLGLAAAVDWYLRGYSRRHDIRADLVQEGMEPRLAQEIEASSYRIIQEALTNVAKHARATACCVRLQRTSSTVLIEIEDDGVGFEGDDPGRIGGRPGLGLIGIRERATRLGGVVFLETSPGKGTRLRVELPARLRATHEIPAGSGTTNSRPASELHPVANG